MGLGAALAVTKLRYVRCDFEVSVFSDGHEMILATRLSILLLGATMLVGCGTNFGPMGAIYGKLTLNGEVQPEGTKVIFMHPTNGHAGFGLTDASGNYRIEWRKEGNSFDGLPVGNYQVMIVPADSVDVEDLSADEMLDGGASTEKLKSVIPAKYMRAATSGLEYDIVEGENIVDLELTSK